MRRPILLLTLAFIALTHAHASDIYFKARDGKWRPLPAKVSPGGVISFTLDPAQLAAGATTIVLDMPRGINLDDAAAPQLLGLKLDGRALKDAPQVDLDWLPAHPRMLTLAIRDAANPLDRSSLKLEVNGQPLAPNQMHLTLADGGKSLRLVAPIGDLLSKQGSFVNTISFRLADLSPQQNSLTRTLTYRCLQSVKESPTLLVDSSYGGYEDLKVMTDGKIMTPGQTTYGSTWASQEEPGDHWVVFAWPEQRELREAKVFWANFGGVFHAPRELLVQTWDGQKWVTQQTLRDARADVSTTIPFGPVTTSRLRLLQPDGKGHAVRPTIMWITEIEVR
ncbi:MAG: hypothetical protein ABFE07_01655 [Armatimonadia bacterium]